jgi:hypothetical protein
MLGRFMDKLPEGFREGVKKHAAAMATKAQEAQEALQTQTAVVRDVAFNKFDTFQKGRLSDGIKFKYETPTLNAGNFKDEVRNLKDNLVIALNKTYGNNNYPTIDCLLQFSPSVKVYRRDPTPDPGRMLYGSRLWKEINMNGLFYPTFGLTTFDQFQTKVNDFNDFKYRIAAGGFVEDLQLKIELSNKFDAEQNNKYSTCNRQISGGHRRRSSRKNVRTIKRVKTAKRSRSVKSRKYRNRK